MRTTINLPPDLHDAISSIAAHNRQSLNQTLADLLRRGLQAPAASAEAPASGLVRIDGVTGLPTFRSPRPVSPEDVKALEDD